MICVVGLGNWITTQIEQSVNYSKQETTEIESTDGIQALLADQLTTRCTDVTTLDSTSAHLIPDESGLSGTGIIQSILTRRLGLIVGCCLGIIVFIVLISVLGWLKVKKQRHLADPKRQQQIQMQQQQQQNFQLQMPPEYMSYRHFSIPHDEANRLDGCPPPISLLHGATMLNSTSS